jgi:hypothetical protein
MTNAGGVFGRVDYLDVGGDVVRIDADGAVTINGEPR